MPITVRELAALVGGDVHGDGDVSIVAARAVRDAGFGDITFAESDKHLRAFEISQASAAVVSVAASTNGKPLIRVADPLAAFITIACKLHARPAPEASGIDRLASVHPTAILAPDVSVHPFAVIGAGCVIGARCRIHTGAVLGANCRLGDDVTLYPQAVLYDDTVLGNRVIIHAHAVIGADGFGYRMQDGKHIKTPQLGYVEIADDVEIGAGATIDRGTFGPTRIGMGTKIDNLVMVGHNCQIGRHNVFAAQVGIAGSCETGDYVMMAGQVGVADHVLIGAGAVLMAQAGVAKNIPANQRMFGTPAMHEYELKRVIASQYKLPELRKRVKAIEQNLGMNGEKAA